MALKDLMTRLQHLATDTPVKNTGYQEKANIFKGCPLDTPDTPRYADTPTTVRIEPAGEVTNDRVPEMPTHTRYWHELAAAYNRHHFKCSACVAAGKGYGVRCGAGEVLWSTLKSLG